MDQGVAYPRVLIGGGLTSVLGAITTFYRLPGRRRALTYKYVNIRHEGLAAFGFVSVRHYIASTSIRMESSILITDAVSKIPAD